MNWDLVFWALCPVVVALTIVNVYRTTRRMPTDCIMCGQPLPRRRWWQLLPPPVHDPSKYPQCELELRRRTGL